MRSFDQLLAESVERHGHLCAGQVVGVRMAMLGCRLTGIEEPKAAAFRKRIIVFVEIDRCATDAIEAVTGCRLGKRTLKFKDFGVNAATFVNLDTRTAYRIVSTESSRQICKQFAPWETDPKRQQLEGYKRMPDDLLFDVQKVWVDLADGDMPGPPRQHAECTLCGQVVRDGKEIRKGGSVLCGPCSEVSYFHPISETDAWDGSEPSMQEVVT